MATQAQERLMDECHVGPLTARVLEARGVTDPEAATRLLSPSLGREWADPMGIPGMAATVTRLGRALDDHERIAVFGDYDVDGITACAIMSETLRELGGDVWSYLPHRQGEGYGMTVAALTRVVGDCHPDLIVTVDNGIASEREVRLLAARGIDACVTDHHEPGGAVPRDIPVCDPKLASSGPSRELCGAGVALKVSAALGARRGAPDLWRSHVDLAALGTLADVMPLTPENRAIVATGTQMIREDPRIGIWALLDAMGRDHETLASDDIPFSVAPCLNAAGRMGDPEMALELLLEDDPKRAITLAGELRALNDERREVESRLTDEATAEVGRTGGPGRVICVGGEGWHEGVRGIVASRLVEAYGVPALVFTIDGDVAHGSGRTAGDIDLYGLVSGASDLLTSFGGHAGAVGCTLAARDIPRLRERLEGLVPEDVEGPGYPVPEVSATLSELTLANIRDLERLAPFGCGNPRPLVYVRDCEVGYQRRIGTDGQHLRMSVTDATGKAQCVMFRAPDLTGVRHANLTCEPTINHYRGSDSAQLRLSCVMPARVQKL